MTTFTLTIIGGFALLVACYLGYQTLLYFSARAAGA